jgi:two-component system, LytTR family, response regulator
MTITPNILKAVIIDDEANAITNLKKLLAIYCPSICVVDTATAADTAVSIINDAKPDVLFLDISMPKKNGFELLDMLTFMPLIVFVTAHEKYAINAIKASAVDFLLKPVDVTELKKMEEKLLKIQSVRNSNGTNESYSSVVGNLVNMLHNPGVIKTITLHDTQGYNIVKVDEIMYLEGDDNYTSFYLLKNKKVMVSKTLKEYEGLLSDLGFLRIHKSNIINLVHLTNIKQESGTEVIMSDGAVLPVSRRRSNDLLELAKQYMR